MKTNKKSQRIISIFAHIRFSARARRVAFADKMQKDLNDLHASFERTTCGGCKKEFSKTYFVVCAECLTKIHNHNMGFA